MTTLMDKSKAEEQRRLSRARYKELWDARHEWAQAHVYPTFKAVFNKDFLKSQFGDLGVGLRFVGGPNGDKGIGMLWGSGPTNGISPMGNGTMVSCTVLINCGALQNYQFYVGVTGDIDNAGCGYARKRNPTAENFSLAFAGTYYRTPGARDGHTPGKIKTVGLPGTDVRPHVWVKNRIMAHWKYWLEHNMKHDRHSDKKICVAEPNEYYPEQFEFAFPEDL